MNRLTSEKLKSSWLRRVYGLLVFLLLFTGFSQMPLSKRYFVADLPGLGWSADFYFVNEFHYVLGALFLGLLSYFAAMYLARWRRSFRLSFSGWLRVVILAVIALSGVFRVLKNDPDVFLGPVTVFVVDMVHLGAVMILGAVVLGVVLAGRPAYLARRDSRKRL